MEKNRASGCIFSSYMFHIKEAIKTIRLYVRCIGFWLMSPVCQAEYRPCALDSCFFQR